MIAVFSVIHSVHRDTPRGGLLWNACFLPKLASPNNLHSLTLEYPSALPKDPLKMENFSLFRDSLNFYHSVQCISENCLKKEDYYFLLNKLDGYKFVPLFLRLESLRGGVCIPAGYALPVELLYAFNVYATGGYFESCVLVVKSLIPCVVIFL